MLPTTRLKFLPSLGGPAGCSTAVQLVLDAVSKLYSPCEVAANSVLPSCARRKIKAPLSSGPPTRCQAQPPSLAPITPPPPSLSDLLLPSPVPPYTLHPPP